MIKVNADQKPDSKVDAEKSAREDATAGSAARSESQKLADEADAFCIDLEKFFRRAYGEVPKSTDLGELRAQQATVRDLVHRASQLGGENPASAQQIAALTAERDKMKDAAARSRADFLNYQSRSAKDLERAEELSLRRYVSELLPVLDSFDLTLHDATGEKVDLDRLKDAVLMIEQSMRQTLAVRGLERIEAKGKQFDPTLHEAVAKRPVQDGEKPNMVAEELRPGYLWKGLILRPAQVLVTEAAK
jgi:molecular chaperone GrpE